MKKYLLMVFSLVIFFLFVDCRTYQNDFFVEDSIMIENNLDNRVILRDGYDKYCKIIIKDICFFEKTLSIECYIVNTSDSSIGIPTVFLDIYDKYAGVMTNEYFKIQNENRNTPEYMGILAKIDIQNIYDDCVFLEPNQSFVIKIDNLLESYDMENFEFETLEICYDSVLGTSNSLFLKKQ